MANEWTVLMSFADGVKAKRPAPCAATFATGVTSVFVKNVNSSIFYLS